jgi:hypothetical protein
LIHIERILRWFELASRLQGNFYKSSLVGINLDDDFTTVWLIQSTVKRELHILLGANPRRISTWQPVISWIHARLGLWKERLVTK